jgi:ABC-2 type transport system permease protein
VIAGWPEITVSWSWSGRMVATGRFMARAWFLELRQLLRHRLFLLSSLVFPVIFASLAFYMFESSTRNRPPIELALSAGLMGMWSATLLGSGNAITRLRYQAVLEPLVASPMPTLCFTLPFAIASATLGIYSMLATLLWSRLMFDASLSLAQPWLFVASLPVTVVSVGLLGLVLAAAFILYPNAQALSNLFEYPVWMLSGMLVPISTLSPQLRVVSSVLAPTWGVKAVLGSASGTGHPGSAVAMCILLSAAYIGSALLLLRRFELLARALGTLSLQ